MITYAGKDLSDFDVRIVRDATGSYAARDVETEQVPGRNGAIVYDNGAFLNVTQPYTMYIPNLDRRRTARRVAAWLLSHADTYYTLYDDYEPDVYRMARFVGPLDVAARLERYGTAQLTFDCKPQRFLAAGPDTITVYPVVSGYLSSAGAMIAGDDYDRRTGYIPIAAGNTIKVGIDYAFNAGTPGLVIAAYTEPGASPGSLVNLQTYTPAAEGASVYEYTVPSGANYVIVAWRSAQATVTIETPDSSARYAPDGPIIENPTLFDAAPLVQLMQADLPVSATVNLQGFAIGDVSVALVLTGILPTMYNDGVLVDCDAMSAYGNLFSSVVNLNSRTTIYDAKLQAEADRYPVLAPGENVINTAGYTMGKIYECPVTELVITPRWWTV